MKKSIIFIILIVAAVIGFFVYTGTRDEQPPLANDITNQGSTTTPVGNNRRVYNNTKYSYRFWYAPEANVQKVAELEPVDLQESTDITVDIPGGAALGRVSAWVRAENAPAEIERERNQIITLALRDFAKKIHQYQAEDKTPGINKQVGNIEEVTIDGETAYQFTLTGSFSFGPTSGAYLIPDGITDVVLIFERNGTKFVITYPRDNADAKALIESFEFVD